MAEITSESAFINALLLTLSSPLTIVFWAGIFTAKITSGETTREEVYYFAAGAILSTPVPCRCRRGGVLTGSFLPGSLYRGA
ncbi:MAG: LysE family transporter [Burkholderiales bacterium]|nr:LysE family transporter [Burkholderiales bacterium]